MKSEKTNKISEKAVRRALAGIVASPDFQKAYRLRELLEHLVNKQLDGEADDLKGYNIGLDVFEKGKNFNPDTDTIVRVQMVRLRRMLEHYYLTIGKNDPLIIDVPKGRYIPAYTENRTLLGGQSFRRAAQAATKLFSRVQRQVLGDAYLSALLIGTISLMFYLLSSHLLAPEKTFSKRAIAQGLANLPTGPSIAVFPFTNETAKAEHNLLIRGIPAHIIHTLTRFKELKIYAPDTTLAKDHDRGQQLNKARRLGASYALIGGFAIGQEKLVVSTFLLRGNTGQIVWSKDYNKKISGDNMHQIQTDIAASVARQLGQPYGIINRLESILRKQRKKHSFGAYECVLQFYDYALHETQEKHKKVRDCLENTIDKNPGHAQAWAALSWIYVDEHRQGFNKRLNADVQPLERALVAAHKAVRIDPDDAFTYRRLADVLIVKGAKSSARDAILRAVELNPNNAEVIADVGWILKSAGEWQEAMKFANKAIVLNPGYPPWYLETPILYHYKNNNCEKALNLARSFYYQSPLSVLREVFSVITKKQCGAEGWEKHARALNTQFPSFLKQPHDYLRGFVIPDELLVRIVNHLVDAGVELEK